MKSLTVLLALAGTLSLFAGVAGAEPTQAQKRQMADLVTSDMVQMLDIGCTCLDRKGGDYDLKCRLSTERYWNARMLRDLNRLSWFKHSIEDMTDREAYEAGQAWAEEVTPMSRSSWLAKRVIRCEMTDDDLHGREREDAARSKALHELLNMH